MNKFNLKYDKYRKVRGGYSRFLEIRCEKCSALLAIYQKDGPGPLKRMYVDRIFSPERLTKLQGVPVHGLPGLVCTKCENIIGIPIIYKKEKRTAFRLFEGSVRKKIMKVG